MHLKTNAYKKSFNDRAEQVKHLFSSLLCVLVFSFYFFNAIAQCPTQQQFYGKLMSIEAANESDEKKLSQAIILKDQFEKCRLGKDSVYARMLHKIGVYQYSTGQLNDAIQNTLLAVQINMSGEKKCFPGICRKQLF